MLEKIYGFKSVRKKDNSINKLISWKKYDIIIKKEKNNVRRFC